MDSGKEGTWIFCYGSNHPEQISRRLEVPLEDVLANCRACTAKGYTRAFMGITSLWNNTSPSTIIKAESKDCKAFAYLMSAEEVVQMDKWEGIPLYYTREDILLEDKQGEVFAGQVYLQVPQEEFVYPDEGYLQACSKTSMAYYYLPPAEETGSVDYYNAQFEIINGFNGKNEGEYMAKILYDEHTEKVIENTLSKALE
ncbi:unnamed protein product [Moneuplotes crassus]|uniref:Gamma-glutamylcyclotransferase AIG2-like domain-containing protein n=1 Tax=Euplotes crassus TaxID=5936 RepID=A0AAD1XV30_EUPCR|nr:unnamed protein product [Moneuplotes crassus]